MSQVTDDIRKLQQAVDTLNGRVVGLMLYVGHLEEVAKLPPNVVGSRTHEFQEILTGPKMAAIPPPDAPRAAQQTIHEIDRLSRAIRLAGR